MFIYKYINYIDNGEMGQIKTIKNTDSEKNIEH